MNYFSFIFLFFAIPVQCISQNFMNNDLNGPMESWTSALDPIPVPYFWDAVEWDDLNCEAEDIDKASPDMEWLYGPNITFGIFGQPYSGETYVSGLHGYYGSSDMFHEGIKQTVDSLVIGQKYTISFYQAIERQSGTDTMGSWSVFKDDVLIGISEFSHSNLEYDDPLIVWDYRVLDFFATNTSHTFKFLPKKISDFQFFTSVRMGIDYINLSQYGLDIKETTKQCNMAEIFPNPVNQKLFIKLNDIQDDEVILTIYYNSGKLLWQEEYNKFKINEIDFSHLEAGCYSLNIRTNSLNLTQLIFKM